MSANPGSAPPAKQLARLSDGVTWEAWHAALAEADRLMKESDGHSYMHILKTRCQHCGRSPRQRGKCVRWFDTFCDHLYRVLSNV